MKTLKLTFSIVVMALLTCGNSWGQKIIHTEATCNFDNYDMGYPAGIVNGFIVYHFTIKLSKETGKIESLHWVAKDCSITNTDGDVVKSIDAGHDTQGVIWDFFNRPNYWNEILYSPDCTYNVEDGWWDNIMPEELPEEGTFVGMTFKIICNGEVARFYSMAQLHINANGEVTANVVKP
jgi:hypothetical protein